MHNTAIKGVGYEREAYPSELLVMRYIHSDPPIGSMRHEPADRQMITLHEFRLEILNHHELAN
jgi:hypothetical protein